MGRLVSLCTPLLLVACAARSDLLPDSPGDSSEDGGSITDGTTGQLDANPGPQDAGVLADAMPPPPIPSGGVGGGPVVDRVRVRVVSYREDKALVSLYGERALEGAVVRVECGGRRVEALTDVDGYAELTASCLSTGYDVHAFAAKHGTLSILGARARDVTMSLWTSVRLGAEHPPTSFVSGQIRGWSVVGPASPIRGACVLTLLGANRYPIEVRVPTSTTSPNFEPFRQAIVAGIPQHLIVLAGSEALGAQGFLDWSAITHYGFVGNIMSTVELETVERDLEISRPLSSRAFVIRNARADVQYTLQGELQAPSLGIPRTNLRLTSNFDGSSRRTLAVPDAPPFDQGQVETWLAAWDATGPAPADLRAIHGHLSTTATTTYIDAASLLELPSQLVRSGRTYSFSAPAASNVQILEAQDPSGIDPFRAIVLDGRQTVTAPETPASARTDWQSLGVGIPSASLEADVVEGFDPLDWSQNGISFQIRGYSVRNLR